MLGTTSHKSFKWDWAVAPLASRTRNTWAEAFALPRCWGGKSWLGTGTTHQRIKSALGLSRRRRAQHTTHVGTSGESGSQGPWEGGWLKPGFSELKGVLFIFLFAGCWWWHSPTCARPRVVVALRRRTGAGRGADLPAWLGAASWCLCVVCSPGHPSAGLWITSSVAYCSDLQKGGRFAALGFNHLLLQPWQQLPEICYAELWQCPLPLQLQF